MEFTKEDVLKTPKNEVVEGVILNLSLKKAGDIFGDKARNPENQVIEIYYEVLGYNFKGTDYFTFYPKGSVPDRSNLGKFLNRYNELKVGQKIKVDFDAEGNYKILI